KASSANLRSASLHLILSFNLRISNLAASFSAGAGLMDSGDGRDAGREIPLPISHPVLTR
ncbi:MAG: hypothetical protein VX017_09070, partial [Pseudomonadota bacterium]|nr:hypothetical protein [Pseudomonadota bacterium]